MVPLNEETHESVTFQTEEKQCFFSTVSNIGKQKWVELVYNIAIMKRGGGS